MLELASGTVRAAVLPELGGGIARFDWVRGAEPVPLFRPWDGKSHDPDRLACYLLVPWSNRVSGGGIEAGGRFWPLAPNVAGEDCPLHGDGWRSAWTVEEAAADRVRLSLRSTALPPFDYRAELAYAVAGASLQVELGIEHLGGIEVPYGLGLHPWLPRTPGVTLTAPAAEVWLEGPGHLPAGKVPVASRPAWDFSRPRALPAGWVNNGFSGWGGEAAIRWPEHRLRLDVAAGDGAGTYLLYSPGAGSGFFCFEPVTHPVDAFHLPGRPGLRTLRRGERLSLACRFTAAESG
jgi:aldose 1-epimerase